MKRLGVFLFLLLVASVADAQPGARTITIVGRSEVTITQEFIQLGDIAEVSSRTMADDEAVIGLKRIWLAAAPKPSEEALISAESVLAKLREQGVKLDSVSYKFPKTMMVKRAGRTLLPDELKTVIEAYLGTQAEREVSVKEIKMARPISVSPGDVTLSVNSEVTTSPSSRMFSIAATVNGRAAGTFPIEAAVEEFKEIPIARRGIPKGSVITDGDVAMARLNVAMLPRDATTDTDNLLGMETTHDISTGEVFRMTKVAQPELVQSGEKVTMKFDGGLFEATATGVALEGGALGERIRVRNESSKKVISGEVVAMGVVQVK